MSARRGTIRPRKISWREWRPFWFLVWQLRREDAEALVEAFEARHPGVTEARVCPIAKLLRRAWDPTGLHHPKVPRALYTAWAHVVHLSITTGKTDEQVALGLEELSIDAGLPVRSVEHYDRLAASARELVQP